MTKPSKRLQERRARQSGGFSRAKINGYAAQVAVNGTSKGGIMFAPTSTVVMLMREKGNHEAADDLEATGWPLVRIKDGVIEEATEDTWI